jgi:hypothetical protein
MAILLSEPEAGRPCVLTRIMHKPPAATADMAVLFSEL